MNNFVSRIASQFMQPVWTKVGHFLGIVIMRYSLVASQLSYCLKLKQRRINFEKKADTTMDTRTVNQYCIKLATIYQGASTKLKSEYLDHAQLIAGRTRKHLIRKLSHSLALGAESSFRSNRGRKPRYNYEVLGSHLLYLWKMMERIDARRMKAALPDWLPKYQDCPAHLKMQILCMSASTIARILKPIKATSFKGLSSTSPARHMKNKVPINTLDHKIRSPGFTQTDTVAHCGTTLLGSYIHSVTLTDVFTTWTENRAIWTKRGTEVKLALKDMEKAFPFKLIAINSDSGSEFLNKHVLEWSGYGNPINFTRSRPYKKNDNCYVEQKNFTHVRELFGYERFEDDELTSLMNDIYQNYWNPLQNFFIPTMKIKEKVRIGGVVHKKHDQPKTPFQRVIESKILTSNQEEELRLKKNQLDPFKLKLGLEQKLKSFYEIIRKQNIRKAA